MLNELPDRDAEGEIAEIYGEIRRLWAVPYVSSLQRHLATRPGWLVWSWAALAPSRGETIVKAGYRAVSSPPTWNSGSAFGMLTERPRLLVTCWAPATRTSECILPNRAARLNREWRRSNPRVARQIRAAPLE